MGIVKYIIFTFMIFFRHFWIEWRKHFYVFAVRKLFSNQLQQSVATTYVR